MPHSRWKTLIPLAFLIPAGATDPAAQEATGCWIRGERADLELRASPFDSAAVELDAGEVKVCYSRPRKLGPTDHGAAGAVRRAVAARRRRSDGDPSADTRHDR
jgi:hypothetical protein